MKDGIETERLAPDAGGIARAAAILRGGGLVAFPTETVYGLGGDARNGRAVARIFEAKRRPAFNPLIAHVADLAAAERIADLAADARRLAEAFWPGPLTLVAPLRPAAGIAEIATAGLPTIALRAPDHPLAQALLAAFDGPVAAPSANVSGAVSPTTAAHVLEGLEGRIEAVLDGGPCPVGIESTIVAFDDGAPVLLRPGGLPTEAIEKALGRRLRRAAPDGGVIAPGMLASHYAPGARLRLDAAAPAPGEGWLGFGPDAEPRRLARNLSRSGDLREAAANLFAHLRELDAAMGGEGVIAVARVPETGLGLAINDRLRRAAAPRETP